VTAALYYSASRLEAGSTKHRQKFQQLVFLVLLCYSPLVQNAAAQLRCEDDPDLGSVLAADPKVR
jgi:hypothetical protein